MENNRLQSVMPTALVFIVRDRKGRNGFGESRRRYLVAHLQQSKRSCLDSA